MHDEHQSDSVYDFLFHDARRIGSFISQFDDAGHLQQVKEGDTLQTNVKRGFSVKAGLSLPSGMPMVEGSEASIGLERSPGSAGAENSERVYDPYWTNARTFLDYAESAGLLIRKLDRARVGQLILMSGQLTVLDTRLVRAALEMPAFAAHTLTSAGADDEDQAASNAMGLELIKVFPMELQATISNGHGAGWMTLAPEHMVVSASDLMLKHGHTIAGQWSVVGVLDALPDGGGEASPAVEAAMETAMISAAQFGTNAVGLIAMMFGPIARMAMGRPAASHGITPLLIFREVSAA